MRRSKRRSSRTISAAENAALLRLEYRYEEIDAFSIVMHTNVHGNADGQTAGRMPRQNLEEAQQQQQHERRRKGQNVGTAAKDCLVLFDTSINGRLEHGWSAGILYQRTKTIKAGDMVEMVCFPIWDRSTSRSARREADRERHREAQARLDEKNAQKRFARLVHANFGEGDYYLTCEYSTHQQPQDEKQALKGVQNFLRRVKDWRTRRGMQPPKYLYVTEQTNSKAYGTRYHHHIIITGNGMDRDSMEALWIKKHGGLCNCRAIQPDKEGLLLGLSRYMLKNKKSRTMAQDGKNPQAHVGRRWNASKNLKQPVVTTADHKISIRKAGQIAEAVKESAAHIFQKLHPDCALIEYEVKRSPWAAGVYIYAAMRRISSSGTKKAQAYKKPPELGQSSGFDSLHSNTRDITNSPIIARTAQEGKHICRNSAAIATSCEKSRTKHHKRETKRP